MIIHLSLPNGKMFFSRLPTRPWGQAVRLSFWSPNFSTTVWKSPFWKRSCDFSTEIRGRRKVKTSQIKPCFVDDLWIFIYDGFMSMWISMDL